MERERDGLPVRQEALSGALNQLGVYLEQLEEKLSPVLRDREPAVAQTLQGTPRGPESPLGGFLRGAAGHASELADRVQELMARVDL
jgi:hypothetical protein